MKFCVHCGTRQDEEDAQFCLNCGAALAPQATPTAQSTEAKGAATGTPKTERRRWWLWAMPAVAVVIAASAVGLVFVLSAGGSSGKTAAKSARTTTTTPAITETTNSAVEQQNRFAKLNGGVSIDTTPWESTVTFVDKNGVAKLPKLVYGKPVTTDTR